ncbi:MAG: DMT family transporter [Gammaproteobacteria bacterium]
MSGRTLHVGPTEWAGLATLVAVWGSAFALTRIALTTLDPWWLTALRINIGALALLALVYWQGQRLPRDPRPWLWFAWLGAIGNVGPFALIAWGQQYVPSSLAGILMAAVPLVTIVIAHFVLADEPLTRRRAAAFVVGFLGVALLIGPLALASLSLGGLRLLAALAILAAATGYALNGVTARLVPRLPGLVLACGVLCVASLQSLLLAALLAPPPAWPPWQPALAVLALGLFPTAIGAGIVYPLIGRAGAGFVALTNYLVPAFSVVLGTWLLDEVLAATDYAGLALILAGVLWSRRGERRERAGTRP